jgi:hypothetical protein
VIFTMLDKFFTALYYLFLILLLGNFILLLLKHDNLVLNLLYKEFYIVSLGTLMYLISAFKHS